MDTEQQQQGKVHTAILAVMAEIGAVGKDGKNKEQNYNFRSVDAVTDAVHPLLVRHQLYVRPLKILTDELGPGPNGKGYRVRQKIVYRITHTDGSFSDGEVTGEGVDYGDKASNKSMAVSFKYFLCQTFCIPIHDPESDPDTHSPEMVPPGERGGQRQGGQQAAAKAGEQKSATQGQSPPLDPKAQALNDLVALLKRKGVSGSKQVLPWLSDQTNPKRKVTKLSDITEAEFPAMKKAADALPAPGTQPAE